MNPKSVLRERKLVTEENPQHDTSFLKFKSCKLNTVLLRNAHILPVTKIVTKSKGLINTDSEWWLLFVGERPTI